VEHAQVLFREEGDVGVVRDHDLRDGVTEHEALHRSSLQHVLFHELGHVLGGELLIEESARVDHHDGAARAKAVAAGAHHGYFT